MHICLQFIEFLLKSVQLCPLAINTGIQKFTAKEIISRLKIAIGNDENSLQRSGSTDSKNHCKWKNDGNNSFSFELSKMKLLCKGHKIDNWWHFHSRKKKRVTYTFVPEHSGVQTRKMTAAKTTPEICDLIVGWTRKNNRAARAARTFFDVVCQTTTWYVQI